MIFFSKAVKAVHFGKREEILKDKNAKSGMLTGSASVDYSKALYPGANNAIFVNGRLTDSAEKTESIPSETLTKINAKVDNPID